MANGQVFCKIVVKDLHTRETRIYCDEYSAQACFIQLRLPHANPTEYLESIEWHFELNEDGRGSSKKELSNMAYQLFVEDTRHHLTICFDDSPHEGREVLRISNLEHYPRDLFMNKLFMIRNLNRYPQSYCLFKKMSAVGVPFRYAMALSSTLERSSTFNGRSYIFFRGYARLLNPHVATVADLRNAANNKSLGDGGQPWIKCGNGYGYGKDQIEGSITSGKRTTSPTLDTVVEGSSSHFDWKGLMKIVAALTGTKSYIDKPEPYKGVMFE